MATAPARGNRAGRLGARPMTFPTGMGVAVRAMVAALTLTWLLAFDATPAWAGKRVALIIANARYAAGPQLRTPPADAALMQQSLRRAGFDNPVLVADATKQQMEEALRAFGRSADGADIALIYFAGHGVEVGGQNYLIPTDARLLQDRDADLEAVRLESVRAIVAHARLRLIILDACRDNPFLATMTRTFRTRGFSRGFADIEEADGEAVFYSTAAGAVADDGNGTNSPFAAALAQRITQPGLELSDMLKKVRGDVMRSTGSVQRPFWYGSYPDDAFYFVPAPVVVAPTLAGPQIEALVWQGALAANSNEGFADYLSRYPDGIFVGQARANIRRSQTPPAPAVTTAVPSQAGGMAQPVADAMAKGDRYFQGEGVGRDYAQAAIWYRRAADAGDRQGMERLATMYRMGWGVPQDYGQDVQWCRRAVEKGSLDCMYVVGSAYLEGRGATKDPAQAAIWYRRAAERGYRGAMTAYASLLEQGLGVSRDPRAAAQWYARAIAP